MRLRVRPFHLDEPKRVRRLDLLSSSHRQQASPRARSFLHPKSQQRTDEGRKEGRKEGEIGPRERRPPHPTPPPHTQSLFHLRDCTRLLVHKVRARTKKAELADGCSCRTDGLRTMLFVLIKRWTKRWTCFAKQQPGRARQKFIATYGPPFVNLCMYVQMRQKS